MEPVWPLVKDLRLSQVAKAMAAALDRLPELPEWHDPALLRREGWPGFAAALQAVQAPEKAPDPLVRARLAYDEALAGQLALALVRRRVRRRAGRALTGDGHLRAQALAAFGHELTPSQAHALSEIERERQPQHFAIGAFDEADRRPAGRAHPPVAGAHGAATGTDRREDESAYPAQHCPPGGLLRAHPIFSIEWRHEVDISRLLEPLRI